MQFFPDYAHLPEITCTTFHFTDVCPRSFASRFTTFFTFIVSTLDPYWFSAVFTAQQTIIHVCVFRHGPAGLFHTSISVLSFSFYPLCWKQRPFGSGWL